jgi:hypothetical protein
MKRHVVAIVLALLAVSGCGADDSNVATPPAAAPTGRPTTLPSAAASILAGLASTECRQIATQLALAGQAFTSGSGGTPSERFAAVANGLEDARDKVKATNVRDAITTVVAKVRQVSKDLEGVTYTPSSGTAPPTEYTDALKALSTPEFAAASKLLSAYLSSGCT